MIEYALIGAVCFALGGIVAKRSLGASFDTLFYAVDVIEKETKLIVDHQNRVIEFLAKKEGYEVEYVEAEKIEARVKDPTFDPTKTEIGY